MFGQHSLLHWSRTQQLVALSSAEAELNASIKAAIEGLGLRNLAQELGNDITVCLRGDSSANDGILKRSGAGKVKHLSVRQLWLQEQVEQRNTWHEKIPREINIADALTHHVSKADAAKHYAKMGCDRLLMLQTHAGTLQCLPWTRGGVRRSNAVWGTSAHHCQIICVCEHLYKV